MTPGILKIDQVFFFLMFIDLTLRIYSHVLGSVSERATSCRCVDSLHLQKVCVKLYVAQLSRLRGFQLKPVSIARSNATFNYQTLLLSYTINLADMFQCCLSVCLSDLQTNSLSVHVCSSAGSSVVTSARLLCSERSVSKTKRKSKQY